MALFKVVWFVNRNLFELQLRLSTMFLMYNRYNVQLIQTIGYFPVHSVDVRNIEEYVLPIISVQISRVSPIPLV